MGKFYFIRHPQSTFNVKNVWCGSRNPKLSKLGVKQCKDILKKLKSIKFDIVYTSPKTRALTLAKMIAKQKNVKLVVDNKLVERNFGKLENKLTLNKDKLEMSNWELNSNLNCGVEKIQSMYFKRVKPWMDKIIKYNNNNNILLIGHSWWGRLIRFYFSHGMDVSSIALTPKNGEILKFNINK